MTDDGRKKQTQMAASKAIGIKGKNIFYSM